MTHPELLWAGRGWPLTDDDHEFLVPAFSRIGRHIHGDKWRDDFPALNPLSVKALRVEDAEIDERAWAHRVLSALFSDTYVEDYEEPPAPVRHYGSLAALGGGPLPQVGRAIAALEQVASETVVARSPGWWFSQRDWERFRAAVHYQNEMQKPKIAMVENTARWLFNRIVRGEIVPFVQNARDGGGWSSTSADDWRMPNPERLRMRIQRCTMVPGRPAVPAGTHWIIINKAELLAAIEKDQNGGNVPATATPNAEPKLEENLLDDVAAQTEEPIFTTGGAGRPSSMHLVISEIQRRASTGEAAPKSKAALAEQLALWLRDTHGTRAPALTAKAMTNSNDFSSAFRDWKAKQPDA